MQGMTCSQLAQHQAEAPLTDCHTLSLCVTQELLVTILREWTTAYGPLLLIMDDFDRADALSWTFMARMAEEIDMAVLVVAAIRPNDGIFATPAPGQVCCLLCIPRQPQTGHVAGRSSASNASG